MTMAARRANLRAFEDLTDLEDTFIVLGDDDLELAYEDEPTLVDPERSFPPPLAPRPCVVLG